MYFFIYAFNEAMPIGTQDGLVYGGNMNAIFTGYLLLLAV